jgi:hypothetical protein
MRTRAKRLAALAAVTAMGLAAAPVGSASADVPHPGFAGLPFPPAVIPSFIPGGFGSVGPWGQSGAVIGPVIITTAPSVFINTNNQVTAGGAIAGGQFAG